MLLALTRKGEVRARKMKRAQVLLWANDGAQRVAMRAASRLERRKVTVA